jgi:enoyl-CoA hydratase
VSTVVVERRGPAVWITLNRPEVANALSRELVADVHKAVRDIAGEKGDRTRAVVLTGAGDRAFSAGADLKERATLTLDETRQFVDALNALCDAVEALPQLTVAALSGVCFGGGLELALACDLRVAANGAEMGLTEVRVGIMPGAGGTRRLPRIVGEARARDLILLGRRISAASALQIGLVHLVAADLRVAVDTIVAEVTGCAPLGVAQAKRALSGVAERECYEVVLMSEDRNEGLRAFQEKRRPIFKGK